MLDKWTAITVTAGACALIGVLFLVVLSPPVQTPQLSADFPYCLHTLNCAGVEEFEGIPFEQLIIISNNYDQCFEDFKLENTCNIQVLQDIERFHHLGFVAER